ncbi:hypothetical protein BofuT4_P082750.1 [Botrytis cinerea T4]|uniref:Uncharacterized protein n=1 Tax=Botryotinia fuckeliana (strain T4) TaxID=999810 RepID=G2YKG8_BOTF4|nr:hypothetical protein BofuT4_P082750.1 [Botrytis cinerea T4]
MCIVYLQPRNVIPSSFRNFRKLYSQWPEIRVSGTPTWRNLHCLNMMLRIMRILEKQSNVAIDLDPESSILSSRRRKFAREKSLCQSWNNGSANNNSQTQECHLESNF